MASEQRELSVKVERKAVVNFVSFCPWAWCVYRSHQLFIVIRSQSPYLSLVEDLKDLSEERCAEMCHSFNAETNKRFHETMPLLNALAKQKILQYLQNPHTATLECLLPGISAWSQC